MIYGIPIPLFIFASLLVKVWILTFFLMWVGQMPEPDTKTEEHLVRVSFRYVPLLVLAPIGLDTILLLACMTHGMWIRRRVRP